MARMSPEQRYYEWLLSDHPQAAAERARRLAAYQAEQAHGRQVLTRFAERTETDRDAPENLRELAKTARWLLARQAERDSAEAAMSQAEWLARARADFELERRTSGQPAYRYPARYLGPGPPASRSLPTPAAPPYRKESGHDRDHLDLAARPGRGR